MRLISAARLLRWRVIGTMSQGLKEAGDPQEWTTPTLAKILAPVTTAQRVSIRAGKPDLVQRG